MSYFKTEILTVIVAQINHDGLNVVKYNGVGYYHVGKVDTLHHKSCYRMNALLIISSTNILAG